jgi:hypothetical protein
MKTKEVFDWVCNIIDSCTDDFHFEGVVKLIDLFHEKQKDEQLRDELILKMKDKWNIIHGIVAPQILNS